MIIEDIIHFLKKHPPYQFLEDTVLKTMANSLSMEFYPKGTAIIRQGDPPGDTIRIIKKGVVKIFSSLENGDEAVMDYAGDGETFGFTSLMNREKERNSVVAVDDTICYTLGRDAVLKLIDSSPALTEYFAEHLSSYVNKTYSEMQNKGLLHGSTDRLLFTTKVGEIASPVAMISEDAPIMDAAEMMTQKKISSLVMVDKRWVPVGIITDKDLRSKVVAKGRDIHEPVKSIMTMSLIRVDAADSCFEAVLKMIKYNIHHILVIREGELTGVMTNHDLMLLQGTSPLSFVRDIENQRDIDGLVPVSARLTNIIGLLLNEGAKAGSIANINTEINDRLIKKVLEIAEKKYGQPPVPYCWVVYGSEGRKEQTFRTDQDNALIYADASSPEEEEEAERYFEEFASFVQESLVKIGFAPCPAQYMANNPRWRRPLRTWKQYFLNWISAPTPDALMRSLILYDMRPLHGKTSLCETLRDYYFSLLGQHRIFLGFMANMIVKNTPPLGFLKSFVVEKSGEHKNEFDLKLKGCFPFIDAVRLFALEKGVKECSTLGRIQSLRLRHSIMKEYGEELAHAFDFIMLLRIQHQFQQVRDGVRPDNFINPEMLSNLQKKTIKEAFHLIAKIQGFIVESYRPFIR